MSKLDQDGAVGGAAQNAVGVTAPQNLQNHTTNNNNHVVSGTKNQQGQQQQQRLSTRFAVVLDAASQDYWDFRGESSVADLDAAVAAMSVSN